MLPENYPHKYVKDVMVGVMPFRFRPISTDDDEMMIRMYSTFSKETIFHRFFTSYIMPPSRVRRFTNIDYKYKMAFAAEEEIDGERRFAGIARYAADRCEEGTAEMAIVIGDPWQGKGIGTALLNHLFDTAEAEGFRLLYGLVHFDNAAVPRIFEKLKQPHRAVNTGMELRYEVILSPQVPPPPIIRT